MTTQKDALNRAVRTFIQFVVIGTLVDVLPVVLVALDGDEDINEGRLGRAVLRAALGGLLAFVMRYSIPPSDTPPAVPAVGGEGGHAGSDTLLIVCVVVIAVVAVLFATSVVPT